MGFSTVVVSAVAAGRSDGGTDPRGLLRTASSVYWLLALGGAVVVYFAVPAVFPLLFRSVSRSTSGAIDATRILLIGGLLAIPRVFFQAVLRGAEQMGGFNVISVATQAAQQLGVYLLASAGARLITLAWWMTAWIAVSMSATFVTARRVAPTGSLRPGWDASAFRRHRAFAGNMAVVSAVAVVQTQGDESAVSWTLPVQLAGYYATAEGLLGRVQSLVIAAVEASLPAMTRAHLDGADTLAVRHRKLHDLICFGSLPLFGAVAFGIGPLFARLFTVGAARMVQVPVAFLALGFFANATVSALYITALGTGRAGSVARIGVITSAVIFPVVVVLTHLFGMVGASLAWLLYSAATYVLLVPRLTRACLDSPALAWFKLTARLLPSLAVFAAGWVCLQVFGPDRIVVVVACLAPALVLHAVLSMFLVGPELRGTASAAWAGFAMRSSRGDS
jgi:O-antigen/teichoic acid export membrane protein